MPPKQDASFPNSLQLCAVYRNSGFCKNSHCRRLHLCPNWLAGYCKAEANCKLVHSTRTPHNTQILKHYMPRLSPSCELLRHKFVLKHAFVRPCTHYWRGKCRFGPATCRNLHCCPSTARGLSCHKGAQCHLSHQINREALKRRKINIPDGFKDVQVAWHYVVVSDPYNEAKLRQAHACDCNRCRKAASAAGGDAPPVASRAESVASASSLGELDGDDGSEEADAASYGDFEDFGVDDSEGEAERTLQAAAAAAAALEEADGEGPLMQEPEREHNSSHGISNDKSYLDDMESPLSTMKLPRNIAGPPSEDKSELYKDKNLDFENVFRHIRSAPLLTLDNVVSFLLTAGGSASVPEFLERFALQSSFPLEQWLSEQPEGRLILREGRLNAYPSVRVCQFYNGVKEGCRNARCERLHVCLWWLADPDGLVHKGKCGLAHGLQDARNKELLARLGLGGVSSQKLLELVRASHPAVCSKYNADSGCDLAECPDIHICNNALHRENKLAKQLCPCARRHVLEPADKDPQTAAKLARFGLQDGNLNFIVRSFLVPAPLRNTLPDMAGDSAPKSAPPSAPPSAPSSATCLPPTLPDVSARGLGLRPAYNALIRRGGQATPSELLADLKLPSDFPLEQWRDDIDELIKPVQSMIDIYKDGGSGQAVSVNVFRRFRICAMHNGVPNSCQKADCSQLHLCLWYLADPEGKVHDKSQCNLVHDLSGRNRRIRSALGIADGLKKREVLDLLRASHPKVCAAYNSDSGCPRPDCPDIHLCNNVLFKHSGRCNCSRGHVLTMDAATKEKLFPFDMEELDRRHVLRSFLVPAPLPNTNPNPAPAAAPRSKPAAPDASDVRGSGDRVDSGQAAAPPLMRQPLVAGPPIGVLQSAMQQNSRAQPAGLAHPSQQQQQPRKPTPDLQNRRQKKLAANSVPNLAKMNLSGQPSKSARRPQQQQRQRAPSGASAAAAAAAAAPAAPPGGPASEGALCEEFLRHECFSQNCRQLHSRLKAPYLWQWRAARSSPNDWKDVDSALNEWLEAAFCERSEFVTVGGGVGGELGSEFPGQLTFSFVAMEIRGISGPPGGLRCLRTASRAVLRRPLATNWRWFFLTDTGAWAPVERLHEPSLNDKLEEALCCGDSSLTVGDFICNLGQMLLSVPGSPQPVPLRRRPVAFPMQQPQPQQPWTHQQQHYSSLPAGGLGPPPMLPPTFRMPLLQPPPPSPSLFDQFLLQGPVRPRYGGPENSGYPSGNPP